VTQRGHHGRLWLGPDADGVVRLDVKASQEFVPNLLDAVLADPAFALQKGVTVAGLLGR